MSEFVDETETLQANVEGMKNLSDSLATFNESFASWLYIMNMNALTTDWPQVRVVFPVLHAFSSGAGAHGRVVRSREEESRYGYTTEALSGNCANTQL